MAKPYAYVRQHYAVDPVPGERVRLEGPDRREGVIAPENLTCAHYVQVTFDGEDHASPCHPRSLEYLGGVMAAAADALAVPASKGDCDKPLTAESRTLERLTNAATQWRADRKARVNAIPSDDGAAWAAFAAANPVSVNVDDLWVAINALKAVAWQQSHAAVMARSSLAGEEPAGMVTDRDRWLTENGEAILQVLRYGEERVQMLSVSPGIDLNAGRERARHDAIREVFARYGKLVVALSSAPDALSSGGVGEVSVIASYLRERDEAFGVAEADDQEREETARIILEKLERVTPSTGAGQELVEAANALVALVEGPGSARWVAGSAFGERLKDTTAWAKFYVATKNADRTAIANTQAKP